jgi:tetratricopeptide (TPR) repeat protein
MRALTQVLFLALVFVSANTARADGGLNWQDWKKKAKEVYVEVKNYAEAKWREWRKEGPIPSTPKTELASESAPGGAKPLQPTQTEPVTQPILLPKTSTLESISELKKSVSDTKKLISQEPMLKETAGQKPDASLKLTKAGVPYVQKEKLIKIKSVPRLNVGIEKSITKSDLIPEAIKVPDFKVENFSKLSTPDLIAEKEIEQWTKMNIPVHPPWREPKDAYGLGKVVTANKIEKVDVQMKQEKVLEALKPLEKMTLEDLKMLNALLVLKSKDKCHIATGLLHDLSNSEAYKEEANFHLGVCAHKMGFHSEAVTRLLRIVKSENQEFLSDAVSNLVEDLPYEYATEVAQALRGVKRQELIPGSAKDLMHYIFAQAAHHNERFVEASQNAEKVSDKSPVYPKARYLYAIGLYGERKLGQAQKTLEGLRQWMEKNKYQDKNLKALIGVNLARILFMQEKYDLALKEYQQTPKDHPLWVQALIEQGWTQLNIGDAEGAIGNMYSLHSPYFKSVFMPNSWVVRTVGYIDICQYGDAYRTLTKLEEMHSSHLRDVKKFLETNKDPNKYYDVVRTYLKGRSDQSVGGLSPQVIREIARRREFLNVQTALNNREDEIAQLAFIQDLIGKDIASLKDRMTKAKARRDGYKANIEKIKKEPQLAKNEFEWRAGIKAEEALLRQLTFELEIVLDARKGYARMKDVALARIENKKLEYKKQAGVALLKHMREVESELSLVLESNEFLRYEVFAGLGENIRYQAAGGATDAARKLPASVKPSKLQNWSFDGEYWEDEIGSYRSSLRNNCPNKRRTTAGVEKGE